MSLNLALVISGNYSGAKDAAQQTRAEIGSVRAEAVTASAAMAAANDQAVASSRRVTDALATQAAAERNLRAEIDRRLGVGTSVQQIATPFANNALRGADIEAYGKSLDALRARFNPIYAAIAQYKAAVMEAQQAERLGAISADERTAAIGRQRVATLASIAAIKAQQVAANSNSPRLSGYQLQGLGFQANDVLTMAAMGAPLSQIAASQGGQIFQSLQMGEGGIKGSLAAIRGSATAAGSALMGVLGTTGLIATGFGLAAVAAGAFYLATREKAKDLQDATEAQRQAVLDLAKAYNDAGLKADDFYRKSIIASESAARRSNSDLQKSAQEEFRSIQSQLGSPYTIGRGQQTYYGARPEFSAFGSAISILNGQIERGQPNFDQFEHNISDIVAQNPGLQTTADKILAIVAAATEAAGKLGLTAGYIKDINRSSVGNFDRTQQAGRDQSVMAQRFGNDPFAALREQQRQKEIQLTEAQQARARSLEQTLGSARLDVGLIGQTTAATEALRLEFQLTAQVREEAARNGVQADQAELASIHAKAVEYGKLKALQEARSAIHGLDQDIELQRAEASTVGQSKLAHDRLIASIKAEQQIRQLGIPLYGAEAEAIRAKTKELSDMAQQTAQAGLQAQLLFDRQQMFRSATEQNVANVMRSAGLDYDPNSLVAAQIRLNDQLQHTKDTWQSIFDVANDGVDALVNSLTDGGASLKDVGRNLAKLGIQLPLCSPLRSLTFESFAP